MNYEIKINKDEVLRKYRHAVDVITNACDWKSTFDPEEIVDIICSIIEGRDAQIVAEYQNFIDETNKAVANSLARYTRHPDSQKDYYGLDTTSIPT